MRSTELDKSSSVDRSDYAVVRSSAGTQPSLVPVTELASSGIDPEEVRRVFREKAYPVGSYIETDGSDPSSVLGGTWTQVFGKFLFATKSGYSYTNTSQIPSDSGKTITLTTDNLPSHEHSIRYTHDHTSINPDVHTHTYNHTHGRSVNSHSHEVRSHTHTDGGHTHTLTTGLGILGGAGAAKSTSFQDRLIVNNGTTVGSVITVGASTAGMYKSSGSTQQSSLTSGAHSGTLSGADLSDYNEINAVLCDSAGGSSTTTTATATLSARVDGYTGGSSAHENMPPYYATNIWKRVA